jgi:integration host factor subunit beta
LLRPPWGEAKLKVELSAVSISRSNFIGNSASTGTAMTKSELIERIAGKQTQLSAKDVELAVKGVLETMSQVLAEGGRIEIRGFGSFSLHYRVPRIGRNPKTGAPVALSGKHVPHFKPGKELRDRVNKGMESGN